MNLNILSWNIKYHFLLAFLIRIVFIIYGLIHDKKCDESDLNIPRYTDIDYQVFTDAARHVSQVLHLEKKQKSK